MGDLYADDLELPGGQPASIPDPDELVTTVMEQWRKEQNQKRIAIDISLAAALGSLPAPWLDGTIMRLGLSQAGLKREKVDRVFAHLHSSAGLQAVLAELPALSREALRKLLTRGGWQVTWRLAREYGDDRRDGWFWNEEMPETPLGLLRVSGLLFVGRAAIGKRRQQIAVVPHDLREPLAALLADAVPASHSREQVAATLRQVLDEIAEYRAQCGDFSPALPLAWLEAFIRALAAEEPADELWAAWNDLSFFLFYLEHFHYEIESLRDVRDYHISELANEFVEVKLADALGLGERRRMLGTVARLYDYLAAENELERVFADQIARAVQQISSGQRQLQHIHRPAPLGGEPALAVEGLDGPILLTLNDLWLLITAAVDCAGSLQQLRQAAEHVQAGELKCRRIDWLLAQDLDGSGLQRELLTSALVEEARHWFYKRTLTEERVW